MSLEVYKALKPSQFDTFAELNENCFTLRIKSELVKVELDEKKCEKLLDKDEIVTGRWQEIKRVESTRAGTERDLTAEYTRLKYSQKLQDEFEVQMDDFAHKVRNEILSGSITKKQAIDICWQKGIYSHKLIMFITFSYYSTVYERKIVMQNEKKI